MFFSALIFLLYCCLQSILSKLDVISGTKNEFISKLIMDIYTKDSFLCLIVYNHEEFFEFSISAPLPQYVFNETIDFLEIYPSMIPKIPYKKSLPDISWHHKLNSLFFLSLKVEDLSNDIFRKVNLKICKYVFMVIKENFSWETLRKVFAESLQQKVLNVILWFAVDPLDRLFSYKISATNWEISIYNFSFPQDRYYPSKIKDLKGSFWPDCMESGNMVPVLFNYTDRFNHYKNTVGGIRYHLLSTFLGKINASLCVWFRAKVNIVFKVVDGIISNEPTNRTLRLDFDWRDREYDQFGNDFYEYTSEEIFYPVNSELRKIDIYFEPFDFTVWILILITSISFGVTGKCQTIFDGFKFLLGQNVFFPSNHKLVYKIMLLHGFLVSTIYLNLFESFNKLRIVPFHPINESELRNVRLLFKQEARSYGFLYRKEFNYSIYNKNEAFLIIQNSWDVFKALQFLTNNYKLKRAKRSPFFLKPSTHGENIDERWIFREEFTKFKLHCYSHGLMQKIYKIVAYEYIKSNIAQLHTEHLVPEIIFEPDDIGSMMFPFSLLGVCLCFCLLCFIIECGLQFTIDKNKQQRGRNQL